jgi:uncharacterized protein (UPF0335 family)
MADGNGGPLAGLKGYLDEISRCDDRLDGLKSEYMNDCKPIRGEIKEIMLSAKEAGLNMEAFRAILRKHRADRRHDKHLQALDLADLSDYKSMEEALGDFIDTPLGQAAKRAAEDHLVDQQIS